MLMKQPPRDCLLRKKPLKTKSIIKQNLLLNKIFVFKTGYPLLYYGEHYFHDTPVTTDHWHIIMLTVFRYSKSQLGIKIDFKVQTWI